MGLLIARKGADFMSGNNVNVRADYEGRVRLSGVNLFPDPGLNMFDPATGIHRYLFLEAPPKPTHWAPYMRDRNTVKNIARQVLGPISLDQSTYDQEDELVNGPSPVDATKALAINNPNKPDARAFQVSDTIGLPEGFYCIAWGYIPDRDWNKPSAAMTNPGPRSAPFYLAQGQGFLLPTPTEFATNIIGLALWISEPRLVRNENAEIQAIQSAQQARLAPMYAIDRWRVRGLEDVVRVVGPFRKANAEQVELPERRNLTFIGNKKDMPKLRVRKDGGHQKHDERISVQVAYAFQTESGVSEVKVDGGWHNAEPGRTAIVFEPSDYEMRKPNAETNRERQQEREATGSIDQSKETNISGEDEETDTRGRQKEKEKTERIRGWRPMVRFKATNDKDDPDDEHGVTEWYMIVDKGGGNGFKEKGQHATVMESEPGKWPRHANTELVRVSILDADASGVAAPTEAPEPPEGDSILELNTSGLTPGKHWVRTSLLVVDGLDELESETSPETEVDVDMGDGIRVRRPRWHNLADNEDAAETDLEDYNKPLGWDFFKPYPNNVRVWNPKRGGIRIEETSNGTGTVEYVRTPVSTLKNDVNRYILRFNVDLGRHTRGKLRAVLEQYDMVDGVPQLVAAEIIRNWDSRVDDHTFEFKISKNQNDPKNKKKHVRMHPDTKEIRVRFEGDGNSNIGSRNFDAEISQYGVFPGWGRPRKSKKLDVKRGEGSEPKDTVYPHGGYCMVVEDPTNNPFTPLYDVIYRMTFESGAAFAAEWTEAAGGATAGGRSQDVAIHDSWGYRTAKTTQGAAAHKYITRNLGENLTEGVLVADYFVQTLNEQGQVDLMWVRNQDGNDLVRLGVTAANKLQVRIGRVGGTDTYTSNIPVDPGDLGRMEIHANGLNSSSASIEIYVTVGDGERRKVFDLDGINMTGIYMRSVRVGCEDLGNTNTLWDIYWDDIIVTDQALENVIYAPGNHIEYYGPHGTPKTSAYGPYGVRVPVKGGETYTTSVNVASDDAATNSNIMRWRARSANHRILETYDFVATGITGDTDWTRYTQTITVPVEAAYIEWFENSLGSGTFWIHGIQVEKGTEATEYTDKNELSGQLSVFFQTSPQGIVAGDPMTALAEVSDIRGITSIITEDDETSYLVDFRSGNTLGTLGSYTTDVGNLNKDHKFIEVRVQLTSTSDTNSPELTRIEIDLARPHSHLLRDDGTEYAGGALVNEVQAESPVHNVERVQFASGAVGDHTWGTVVLRRITFTVVCFRPQTAAEIVEAYGNEFVRLQSPYGRLTLRIDEVPQFDTNPQTRLYLDPQRQEYFQVYTSTFTGIVEAEEVF